MFLRNNKTFVHDSLIILIDIILLWSVTLMNFLYVFKTKLTAASVSGLISVNSRCIKFTSNNTQLLTSLNGNYKVLVAGSTCKAVELFTDCRLSFPPHLTLKAINETEALLRLDGEVYYLFLD